MTADDLGAGGALTVLMKDAIRPNLMQTLGKKNYRKLTLPLPIMNGVYNFYSDEVQIYTLEKHF